MPGKAMNADIVSFLASSMIILLYHIYLFVRLRFNPNFTIHAVSDRARHSWVAGIMSNPNNAVLAVQTLRNSTMAATFLASTAILLVFGLLNITVKRGTLDLILLDAMNLEKLFAPNYSETELVSTLMGYKLLLLLIDFLWAFFSFSLSIRAYNHVGYLINSHDPENVSTHYVAQMLNDGGDYYTLGMRAYYLSVPLVFWMCGPYFMLAASLALVVFLHRTDHAPSRFGHR
ncbi:MAG: DUF599 domain-containing protein [Magnetococcales bacterium]|nr:DUF599 domain-containing protein [Magnetococcales bacterium]MBF0419604.1 DUF599 domain-containing protein [Magnetococcales bacterium]